MKEYFKNLPQNLIASNGNEIWTRHNQRPGRKVATVTKTKDGFKIEFEESADSSERQLVTSLFGGN